MLAIQCRVEHILCHAMDTSADSTKCKNAMSACLRGAPGSRPLQQHQGGKDEAKIIKSPLDALFV